MFAAKIHLAIIEYRQAADEKLASLARQGQAGAGVCRRRDVIGGDWRRDPGAERGGGGTGEGGRPAVLFLLYVVYIVLEGRGQWEPRCVPR